MNSKTNRKLTLLMILTILINLIPLNYISAKGDTDTSVTVSSTGSIKYLLALADSDLEASADSATLRANGVGPDWYESRNDTPTLLTLDTSNIAGNPTKKAAIRNYGLGGVAYLTQELNPPQTDTFSISFDIYIDRIEDSGNYDRSGIIYVGDDSISTNAPTGTSNERFVFMAFYDASPGDSGNDLQLRARTSSGQSWSNTAEWTQLASDLSYDNWYIIRVELNVTRGSYDVYVDEVLAGDDVPKYSGYSSDSVEYISFVVDSTARGDFLVDNVYSPAMVPEHHTITATAGFGGSITPSGVVYVTEGDDQAFTITADPGYHISDVLVDGTSVGTLSSYTFISVITNHAIDASFEADVPDTGTITASAGAGGIIDPDGPVIVPDGGDQAFTITPDAGYHISDVLVDGLSVGAVSTYAFTSYSDHTIHALFELDGEDFVYVTVNENSIIGSNKMATGFMLDFEWNNWRNSVAQRELTQSGGFKLIRIDDFRHQTPDLGPCIAWNSDTSTGTFDWTNVDDLVDNIFAVGAEPLIVLGWARIPMTNYVPAGMELKATGLPDPDDWAAYTKEWVRHFKNEGLQVRFYEVTNEPWTYFGWNDQPELSNFLEIFTSARTAMKAEDSNVLVGFDGTNRKPVLDYILDNGHDLDFISFHKYDSGSIGYYTDEEMLNRAENYQMKTSASYYGIQDSRQRYYDARSRWIPVLITEYNFVAVSDTGTDPKIQQMVGTVWTALGLRTGVLEGLDYNVYYAFSSSASWESQKPTGGMGFSMINSDNDQPWYSYYVYKFIGNYLSPGDELVDSTSGSEDVRSLAWIHEGKIKILLICKVDEPRIVYLSGVGGDLNYTKIDGTIPWQTPAVQTGIMDSSDAIVMNGYTVMLLTYDST